ncbi:hypothetical protein [uncultured Desulfosarcina sp.]|uniref:hypothetical protein n=1 Tax=uncultured Desulfosarcina sp. TaxID=218289 RepID=UPI0029C722BF|nr:hypothetical protein [uncultured Desulfosarcina sp.]
MRAYAGTQQSADSEEVSYFPQSPETTTYSLVATADQHGSISPGSTITVAEGSETAGASLIFQLTVIDAGGFQVSGTCLVTVAWVNTPPLADAGSDQQVNIGDEVILDGSLSTDADSDPFITFI